MGQDTVDTVSRIARRLLLQTDIANVELILNALYQLGEDWRCHAMDASYGMHRFKQCWRRRPKRSLSVDVSLAMRSLRPRNPD